MLNFKTNLLIILLLISFKASSGVLKGAYANLEFQENPDYTSMFITNKIGKRLICHWGIDGYQWISYVDNSGITDNLYFDNNKYKIIQVSFRCVKDKKSNHKIGTFKIYPNKYN